MQKKIVKFLSVIMAVIMVIVCAPVVNMGSVTAEAASAASGSFGGNVKWVYNSKSKIITVSGTGNMSSVPNWDKSYTLVTADFTGKISNNVTKIVINEGVTNVCNNAFKGLPRLQTVTLPSSVTAIGQSAFEGCSALNGINFTENLKSIGAYAFKKTKLGNFAMPYSVTSIGDYAFDGVSCKITCNYDSAAYNYCKKFGTAYTLRQPAFEIGADFDNATSTAKATLKIKDAAGINDANITLTYDESIIVPSIAESDVITRDGIMIAIVKNAPGKISVAIMAQEYIKYAECSDKCEYPVAEISFKVISDKATDAILKLTPDHVEFMDNKVNVAAVSADLAKHEYNLTSRVNATCKSEGKVVYTCSDCGKIKEESIPVNPANHDGGTEVRDAAAPTCVMNGYDGTTYCLGCGMAIAEGKDIPATGIHTYGEWVVITPATCAAAGLCERKCVDCDATESETIAKLAEHTYVSTVTAPTCTEDGYTTYTCSVCGDSYVAGRTKATGHDLDENNVCKVCGTTVVLNISFKDAAYISANEETKYVISKKTLKAADLIANIATDGWTVETADGKAIADGDYVPTGSVIKSTAGASYTVVIVGDVDLNGKLTAADARVALRVSAKLDPADGAKLCAMDLDGNGKVNVGEARTILRVSAKLEVFK